MHKAVMIGLLGHTLAGATAAHADIALSRMAYVERISDNGVTRSIQPVTYLRKGDTVILTVDWTTDDNRRSFTLSSRVPAHLAFKSSSHDQQSVSIDGGHSWGKLGTLKKTDSYGTRLASVEDVTHLSWEISAHEAAHGSGTITYSAIVR